jgi:hypothetical protein
MFTTYLMSAWACCLARQRRGEPQRAVALRRGGQHPVELVAEAHVEHLVGLVEHEGLHLAQLQRAALDVVADAARRPHHEVHPVAEGPQLLGHRRPAHARDAAHAGGAVEPLQLLLHLEGELAGGGEHQGPRRGGARERGLVAEEGVGEREAEGDRLPGAGLGRDEEVAAEHRRVEHRGLDGGGVDVAARLEGLEEGRVRAEISKGHGRGRYQIYAATAIAGPTNVALRRARTGSWR